MSLNLFDRVKETCFAPGTGTVTLLGAVTGFQSFAIIGNANTCYYTIADQYGANWEVGIGTYTLSGTTLARTTVLSSSAGGTTKANFSTGIQDVFVTYPAEKAFSTDMILGVPNGGTGLTTLTTGYIPFGNGTSAFGSSSNLFWDSVNSRLGVGFSSPTAQIEIAGYPNATFKIGDGGSGTYTFSRQAGDGYFHSVDNIGSYGFIWTTGSTEIMRTSSGNLLVGNSSVSGVITSGGICVAPGAGIGSILIGHTSGTASGESYASFWYNNTVIGTITQAGTTGVLYNVTSDYRLKDVVGSISDSGSRIDALQPINYTMKADGSAQRGFLAHQFQAIYPNSVSGEKDAVDAEGKPIYQAMQASSPEVMADLIAEIQSLRARLKAANIA